MTVFPVPEPSQHEKMSKNEADAPCILRMGRFPDGAREEMQIITTLGFSQKTVHVQYREARPGKGRHPLI